MEKATLACLRFWGMANASKKLGIHTHPAVVKIEHTLQREFMQAMRIVKVSDVN